jgi:hypothetical protein
VMLRPIYADIIKETTERINEVNQHDAYIGEFLLLPELVNEIILLREANPEFVRICHICGHAVITHRAAMRNEYPKHTEKKSCKECDCTTVRKVCD